MVHTTTEQILEKIKDEHGKSALRDGQSLLGLFQDYSHNQLRPQANALRIFLDCKGNQRILNLCSEPGQKQQTEYHRLIQEMVRDYNMQEATAADVCAAFWRVAIGTEPPILTVNQLPDLQQAPPEPVLRHNPGEAVSSLPKDDFTMQISGKEPDTKHTPPLKRRWILAVVVIIIIGVAAWALLRGAGGDSESPLRDLTCFNLDESVQTLVLNGTEDRYTYPDDSCLELYFGDGGTEMCRIYASEDGSIENLFAAEYDTLGRVLRQQVYDGQGSLLRTDEYAYEPDGSALRTVSLPDGRIRQGVATFDETGKETYSGTDANGGRFVYIYDAAGIFTQKSEWDSDGNELTSMAPGERENLYGPRDTVIGKISSDGFYSDFYVRGICGDPIKEYTTTTEGYGFVDTYDMLGRRMEHIMYESDGSVATHTQYFYDEDGVYTGHEETWFNYFPKSIISKTVTQFNQNGAEVSSVEYDKEGNQYEWSKTELDDLGREKATKTYDSASGRLKSLDELEYDKEGNVQKRIRTVYDEDGGYSIGIADGDYKTLGYTSYYASGQIQYLDEYNAKGEKVKSTSYYENGQLSHLVEYNSQGERIKDEWYDEDGTARNGTE